MKTAKLLGLVNAIIILFLFLLPIAGAQDITDVSDQLDALKKKHIRYQIRAEQIQLQKSPLADYFLLLSDIEILEKEIEELEQILEQSSADMDLVLPSFEIKAFLDKVQGAPIKDYVSNGDIVAFSADVEHPLFDGDPKPSEIFWQLYDNKGNPVPGVLKRKQTYEGGIVPYTFRFRLDSLPSGIYKVGLTHYLLESQEIKTQTSTSFEIFDAASIKKIIVTDKPGGKENQSYLTNDKLPHIYVYYTLAKGVESADATIMVVDAKSGDCMTSVTQTRPKEKQYLGIRLEKNTLKSRQNLKVVAKITTPDQKTKTLESRFSVGFYKARILLPIHLKSREAENFRVSLPNDFKGPFLVNINPSPGVVAGHTNNGLTGTVTGIATDYNMSGWLEATVTDSTGRIAKGIADFMIKTKPKQVVAGTGKSSSTKTSFKKVSPPDWPMASPPSSPCTPSYADGKQTLSPKTGSDVEWRFIDDGAYHKYFQVKKGTGKKHGLYLEFRYQNDQIKYLDTEGWYENGKMHGVWRQYSKGKKYSSCFPYNVLSYRHGKEHGPGYLCFTDGAGVQVHTKHENDHQTYAEQYTKSGKVRCRRHWRQTPPYNEIRKEGDCFD